MVLQIAMDQQVTTDGVKQHQVLVEVVVVRVQALLRLLGLLVLVVEFLIGMGQHGLLFQALPDLPQAQVLVAMV